ncbi:hypothetical protein A3J61_01475 [Candidatus Nomurabacteria bacterium RIFCSPHIGHO2_02_FULL_38_15]|uniref:DUF1653 domain-containing protein n=1 Tax=Candidatus Nomurabacteria bacterium RIFCSPHIGHO2_02_FULL_38_15 TaxID=1801752 RepID=A0A1F6VQU4_9BACT|nr:MAG: hypothetical protein A3J61_01475 [Candidatus Nomurabacteria bacterium RIFCSPHIGHO2_02_FULL_38_15]
MEIEAGQIYKHYKGDAYKIITLAKHSETEEWMIVYERLTDTVHSGYKIWARPQAMFFDHVEKDGYSGPRFEYVSE